MKLKLFNTAATLLTVLALAACHHPQPQAKTEGAPGICRPDAANALAGKSRIGDAEAKQATGASIVRQIQPGQGVTMDYRQERVTIETDPQTDKIVRAFCG